eukprot:6879522-Alexandrium_andersonii.AAC.1
MTCLLSGTSLKQYWAIADAKQVFTQSAPMRRSGGSIYVEPCPGLGAPPGALLELLTPVYGLGAAPLCWRRT